MMRFLSLFCSDLFSFFNSIVMFRVVRGQEANTYNILPGKIDPHVEDEQVIMAQYINLYKETTS